MSEGYYVPGPERAARVQALFDRIATRYDRINDWQSFGLHRLWKRRMVRLAEVRPGERALDVCCGTGDLAEALQAAGAEAAGCDFSAEMLAVAAKRAGRPCYTQGDALHLPFANDFFDIVAIGYGLRNLANFPAGCAELLRVVKPGARLVILDFGKPSNRIWRKIYFAYLRLIVPVFGKVFCGDSAAYSYILESLEHYPAQEGVSAQFRKLGCASVELFNLLGGVMSIHRIVKPGHLASATM